MIIVVDFRAVTASFEARGGAFVNLTTVHAAKGINQHGKQQKATNDSYH